LATSVVHWTTWTSDPLCGFAYPNREITLTPLFRMKRK